MVAMQIFTSEKPLTWGKLELPMMGLTRDWFGERVDPPSTFTLANDAESLWFISVFPHATEIHPDSSPGQFTPELWKYDVAELFIANPETGEYLEFNLTANGAWWACRFSSVRHPSAEQPGFSDMIRSHHDPAGDRHFVAGLRIPLIFLKKEIDFSASTTANITIIRDSPSQRFLSACKLPGPQPDFHQPQYFTHLSPSPIYPD